MDTILAYMMAICVMIMPFIACKLCLNCVLYHGIYYPVSYWDATIAVCAVLKI